MKETRLVENLILFSIFLQVFLNSVRAVGNSFAIVSGFNSLMISMKLFKMMKYETPLNSFFKYL